MKYAIWQDGKVLGYIDLTERQASILNSIRRHNVYIGHDDVTAKDLPENYGKTVTVENILRDGECFFDMETEEYEGFRRIRIIGYRGDIYIHQMFNGETIEMDVIPSL